MFDCSSSAAYLLYFFNSPAECRPARLRFTRDPLAQNSVAFHRRGWLSWSSSFLLLHASWVFDRASEAFLYVCDFFYLPWVRNRPFP
ncbi:MAG: hypothetical protein EBX61_08795 [Betaproteobacteria bacterium]|nr:hypothetical protein [Betaproteobacteria bacterium]